MNHWINSVATSDLIDQGNIPSTRGFVKEGRQVVDENDVCAVDSVYERATNRQSRLVEKEDRTDRKISKVFVLQAGAVELVAYIHAVNPVKT